jgi:hypothetical protein
LNLWNNHKLIFGGPPADTYSKSRQVLPVWHAIPECGNPIIAMPFLDSAKASLRARLFAPLRLE